MRKEKGNTMKMIICSTLITVGLVMMMGSAGDCDGKCMENANTVGETIMFALTGLVLFGTGAFFAIIEKK